MAGSNKIMSLAKTLKKNTNGYNYKYVDLTGIHEALAEAGISYWQEVVTAENGKDYIKTHVINDEDGEEIRVGVGSEIINVAEVNNGKMNPAQILGTAITYARRYSLLLILGLATEDDDAEALTQSHAGSSHTGHKRLDFDEVRETLDSIDDIESINEYSKELSIQFPKMTSAQKIAVSKMFEKRRKDLKG